jgi:hypothetical protein
LRLSRSHRRGARVDRQAAGGQPRTHHWVVRELWEQVYVVGHPGDLGRRAAPRRVAGGVSKTWYLIAIEILGSSFIDTNYDCPLYRWRGLHRGLEGSANGASRSLPRGPPRRSSTEMTEPFGLGRRSASSCRDARRTLTSGRAGSSKGLDHRSISRQRLPRRSPFAWTSPRLLTAAAGDPVGRHQAED